MNAYEGSFRVIPPVSSLEVPWKVVLAVHALEGALFVISTINAMERTFGWYLPSTPWNAPAG